MPQIYPVSSIDEVIAMLDTLIDWAYQKQSRLGYFPALYRKVTLDVKEKLGSGYFEDDARMERLDVLFANRYLEAVGSYLRGQPPTHSWAICFDAARRWRPIVLQHLLLGMNAHINLDLGIAAARTAPGTEIEAIRNDFIKINQILSNLVDEVQSGLARIWPLLKVLDWLSGRADEQLMNFSLKIARDRAWETARRLAMMTPLEQADAILELDRQTASLSAKIINPGPLLGPAAVVVRCSELRTVRGIIKILR